MTSNFLRRSRGGGRVGVVARSPAALGAASAMPSGLGSSSPPGGPPVGKPVGWATAMPDPRPKTTMPSPTFSDDLLEIMRNSADKGGRNIGERFRRKQGRQGEKLAAGGGCGRFHAMRLDPEVRRTV